MNFSGADRHEEVCTYCDGGRSVDCRPIAKPTPGRIVRILAPAEPTTVDGNSACVTRASGQVGEPSATRDRDRRKPVNVRPVPNFTVAVVSPAVRQAGRSETT